MTTTEPPARARNGESGLLSPGWAGTGAADLVDDTAWVDALLAVEEALARAQAELGVVPAGTAAAIAAVRARGGIDPHVLADGVYATANPVVAFVGALTAAVRGHDPEAAEYVHRGSTSQDVLDTAMMLLAARALERVDAQLTRCAEGLARLVDRHRDTPMAGRTLTQHAVPITFGLKAAGWLTGVLDARDRVRRVLDGGLPVSLGGAAGTLGAYAEYARMAGHPDADGTELVGPFAAHLGLAAPALPWHGVRTPVLDVAAAAAHVAGALGRFAQDVQVGCRTEIGELAEPAAPGRGASSAMPQKHNPVYATLVATAARQLPATALVLVQSAIVEDERSAGGWHAEWQPMRECLRLLVGAATNAADLAGSLIVDPVRMLANLQLTGGAVVSERVGAALAPVVGKAAAKALLTRGTDRAAATGRDLVDVLAEELADTGHEVDPGWLRGLLDPRGYTGAAGALADRALARLRRG